VKRRARLLPLALVALGAVTALAPAHVRLINPATGASLYWANPASISIVIQSDGSDDIPDGSHTTAIRGAIAAWNAVGGSAARLVENSDPAQRARSDWQADGLHLVLFDEDDLSGYFPDGCGIVALTPTWFSGGGSIVDSDVLFNGKGFQFTTSGAPGRFDVQDVATHELGHLLGLDHSGWAGASMYPYVDPTILLHRSLSQDELHGMRQCYPAQEYASAHGTLRHDTDRPVKGAQVVALDAQGRPCAAALSSGSGTWRIDGLDPGTYTFYAAPLDGPVTARNFGAGHSVQINFARTELGAATLAGAQDLNLGPQTVLPESALELGRVMDDFPRRIVRGVATTQTLHGNGLVAGSALACSDPDVLVTPLSWHDTHVQFAVSVPADEPDGNLDLSVTNPQGETRTLVAGLEITPPNPLVFQVQPALGTDGGGTLLTLHGANFRPGARVVIGAGSYADGEPGGCTVLDTATIRLTTSATAQGSCDVVVIDSSGVEGRLAQGFAFAHVPEIQSTFPTGGFAGGGTEVVLRGQDFAPGALVRIDGVPQTLVALHGTSELVLTTNAGLPGGPYLLEVENPGGAIATSAFSYSAQPDPLPDSLEPASGPPEGGNTITIHGSNLGSTSAVLFGADPATGAGGTPASALTVIDEHTLAVVAPPHAPGTLSLLVRDDLTGQAAVLPEAYTFGSPPSSGGGGCYVLPGTPPAGPRELLIGLWWLFALLALRLRSLHWRACPRPSSLSTSR
jgi:Matrixin/IPT/TIG domain